MKVLLFTLCFVLSASHDLRFNSNGKFKMVQFTDLHLSESDDKEQTFKVIRKVLEIEKPDLAVVSGDVVSGYEWKGKTTPWYAPLYDKFAKVLIENNQYWALTAGNHDSEADLTRE